MYITTTRTQHTQYKMFIITSKELSKIQDYTINTVKSNCLEACTEFNTEVLEGTEIRNLLNHGSAGNETALDCTFVLNDTCKIHNEYPLINDQDIIEKLHEIYNIEITTESFYDWCLINVIISSHREDVVYEDTISIREIFNYS